MHAPNERSGAIRDPGGPLAYADVRRGVRAYGLHARPCAGSVGTSRGCPPRRPDITTQLDTESPTPHPRQGVYAPLPCAGRSRPRLSLRQSGELREVGLALLQEGVLAL